MKVRDTASGTERKVDPADYSAEAVKLFAETLTHKIRLAPDAAWLPAAELVERFSDLFISPDNDSNPLATRLSPFWSSDKVEAEFGKNGHPVTRQALADRRRRGTLLGLVTSDNTTVYPVCQFHRVGGRVEVKPGVKAMLGKLKSADPWAVGILLSTQAEELGGFTPLDIARKGDHIKKLTQYADLIRREWKLPL